ncbi:hypothetical protein PtA15_2A707 [Puccinia triticina]|uniref:Uncharacterized protein n=1 Tax=Puccinia triticina TaxID=208348 RepID=A0ABY7CB90_9BASI|nr:uncharacterized protein PtA15_2A707 [Puccinia triticina]WAQ82390.1 hypothetical protein PtA15_2A707 [Puccinia triticina]WAR53244.1 hypothetical protein PtB15_2B675 [Puccinia triticina]
MGNYIDNLLAFAHERKLPAHVGLRIPPPRPSQEDYSGMESESSSSAGQGGQYLIIGQESFFFLAGSYSLYQQAHSSVGRLPANGDSSAATCEATGPVFADEALVRSVQH